MADIFEWKSELGLKIVNKIDEYRKKGLSWRETTRLVNRDFEINFHKDKLRKAWRIYANGEVHHEKKLKSDNYEKKIDGNNLEIEAKVRRIKTLNDLLEACDVDLSVWKIERYIINKWEVGAKDKKSYEIKVEPLFQVKVWLSKIIPTETKFPVIQPIYINELPEIVYTERLGGLGCALIIPDSQIGFTRDMYTGKLDPFHDRKALDIAVQLARDLQPDHIILLGDMVDLPDWSDKFVRSPEMYWTSQPAFIELAWWIGRLISTVPHVKIDYLAGNHEERMKRALLNHMVAAYDLRPADNLNSSPAMSVDNLVGLSRMGVKYHDDYPKSDVWVNDNLRCRHGNLARKGGGNTSRAVLRDTFVSEIVGHSHRLELTCKTVMTHKGMKSYMVFSPGTVCRIDGVVPGFKAEEDWQQGLGVVYYEEGDGRFEIIPVSINNGKALYNGSCICGVDGTNDLRDQTGWMHF